MIHIEADNETPVTVQDIFTVWGVKLTEDQLGAYTEQGARKVHVYNNGKPAPGGLAYEFQDGDNVVVAYGRVGSFETEPSTQALQDA